MPELEKRFVEIYLNDHLAGATAVRALARRMARSLSDPADRDGLRKMLGDIEADGRALRTIMRSLDVPVARRRIAAGWAAEKLGRLKPNGRLVKRSPLSDLVEIEALSVGVSADLAGWTVLRDLAETTPRLDPGELDRLIGRAEGRLVRLERLHRRVGAAVLVGREGTGRVRVGGRLSA